MQETGAYAVNLVTTGKNYDSSTGYASFNVRGTAEAVEIIAPLEGDRFNISDMMYPTIACYKNNMYTKLLLTDPNGAEQLYQPDGRGVCYIRAEIPGTYKMKAYASSVADFDIAAAEAQSAVVSVTVNAPAVSSVQDVWGNDYGVVFVGNEATVIAQANCLGTLEAFVDNVSQGAVAANADNAYRYTFKASGLSEGAHSVGFKATCNGITSEMSSISVYGITKLAVETTKYAREATLLADYPAAGKGRWLSKAAAMTLLGTYGGDYAYVKSGQWYGFVRNSVLADWDEVVEKNVEEVWTSEDETGTAEPAVSENEFRLWAAEVIDQYYRLYAQHDRLMSDGRTYGEYYRDFDFKFLHPIRDFWWRKGVEYTDINIQTIGQFDGLYRGYYFLSLYKMDYDFNDSKDSFTVIRLDGETDAEYEARMLPFYKALLVDTMKKKAEIDAGTFTRLDGKVNGQYTLKLDESTGKLTMQRDTDGVMGNLEQMADSEANKAWIRFGADLMQTVAGAAIEYANVLEKKGAANDYLKEVEKAAAEAVTSLITKMSDTYFDSKLAQLENDLYAIKKAEIANLSLRDYNRIIAYLNNVYEAKDDAFIDYLSDPVFKKAVTSLISTANSEKYVQSEKYAQEQMEKWYSDGVKLKKVLTKEEMLTIMGNELVVQLVNVTLAPLKQFQKEAIKSGDIDKSAVSTILKIITDSLKSYITVLIQSKFDSIMTGEAVKLNADEQIKALYQAVVNDVYKVYEGLFTMDFDDSSVSDAKAKCVIKTLGAVVKKQKEIYEIISSSAAYDKVDWQKIADLSFDMVGEFISAYLDTFGEINAQRLMDKTKFFDEQSEAYIKGIGEVWDDMMTTAESLAKAANASLDDLGDEKQMSYRAVSMVAAYKGSSPIERGLDIDLELLKARTKKTLKAAIVDRDATTVAEILDITDRIMLQVEYDLIGSKWLADILKVGEANGRTTFYKHIEKQVKGTQWENQMTSSTALANYNAIFNCHKRWLKGWKEEYRELEKQTAAQAIEEETPENAAA